MSSLAFFRSTRRWDSGGEPRSAISHRQVRRPRCATRYPLLLDLLEDRTLLSSGDLDPSFGLRGKVLTDIGVPANDSADSVTTARQTDGKIVVAGSTETQTGGFDLAVVRYNSDGTLDRDFGDQGSVTIDLGSWVDESGTTNVSYDTASGVAIDSQGNIVVSAYAYQAWSPTGSDFVVASDRCGPARPCVRFRRRADHRFRIVDR